MLPLEHPDRIQITFDDHRLVANAGLILPTTLARHLGLPQLVQQRLDLGDVPGRADTSDKLMTLVAANAAWLAVQVMAHNLARWTARIGLGEQLGDHQDPQATLLLPDRTVSPARRAASLCIFPSVGPGKTSSVAPWHDCEPCHFRPDGGNQLT